MKVSSKNRLIGSKSKPKRSDRKCEKIALSEMNGLLCQSKKRLLGEEEGGGVQPMNGFCLKLDLMFSQKKIEKASSGLTRGNFSEIVSRCFASFSSWIWNDFQR